MASKNARRMLFASGIVLLIGLAANVLVTARRSVATHMSAVPAHTRAYSVTFLASEFSRQADGYLSLVRRVPFSFTAAGAYLLPTTLAEAVPRIEVRLGVDGGDWSPWYAIGELELQDDGRMYGERLVAWPQASEVQVLLRTPGRRGQAPLADLFRELTIVAIDASTGPTTDQAVSSAQARAEAQGAKIRGSTGVPQPVIISRAEWGADESLMTWPPEFAPVDKMMLHHTVTGGGGDPVAELRTIYYFHAVTRGWGDIGYNFIVDRWGNVYEGRYGGLDVIGAHVRSWNAGSIGVSVLGCYEYGDCAPPQIPTAATLTSLADLVAWASSRSAIDPRELKVFSNGSSVVTNYVLSGHRDYAATACPGSILYAELPGLRQTAWGRLPEYDVRFGWHDTPSSIDAGQQVTVYPNLWNHGRLVWSDAAGVHLGYRWIQNGEVVAENATAARIIPDAVVGFGEMTALVAQLSAPITPGAYTLRWDLYHDSVGWFADQPAPVGRSLPLDLNVEVNPVVAMDVRLDPLKVSAAEQLHVEIALEGAVGQTFEAQTHLPPQVNYVVGSSESDVGNILHASNVVTWVGTLNGTTARARFSTLISAQLATPQALSISTTLNAAGHPPLAITRWFIVNGYDRYLPLVNAAWPH